MKQDGLALGAEAEEGGRALGVMRVSLERGLFKQIDVPKVARGRFLTERSAWLVDPVRDFITRRLAGIDRILDPFAGDGDLLKTCAEAFGLPTAGYDLEGGLWPKNDSLVDIPKAERTLIVTNPPYLARHSARRKGIVALTDSYYDAAPQGRSDLYQLALDRCREAASWVVAIVPETVLLSPYPKSGCSDIVVIEDKLFSDTDTPVAVVCFDRSWTGETTVWVGSKRVGSLSSLMARRPAGREDSVRVTFNDPRGRIGLRAVDGVDPACRIAFVPGEDFGYDRSQVKHSSRLMTYVELPDLSDADLGALVRAANELLEETRRECQDVILAPFKGNNHAGIRRRRLDFALARQILVSAAKKIMDPVPSPSTCGRASGRPA